MVSEPAEPVVEIADSTWRLRCELGGRNVFQYLLATADREQAMLIDTGVSDTPREVLVPALRELGIGETALRLVIVTHPDLDHQGGLAAIRERFGGAITSCGFYDRAMVSDPERLLADRYQAYLTEHGLGFDSAEGEWMRGLCGVPVDIDLTFSGGETVDLGDRRLVIHHAPGHSAGHIVVQEPGSGLLFSSDAIHGRFCPGIDGSPALCPTYEELDAYLGSVELLERIAPAELHSGHWPARSGAEVGAFLAESRAFVGEVDTIIARRLMEPATLSELCEVVQECAGPWLSEPGMLRFCVHGHLRRMLRRGIVADLDPTLVPRRFLAVAALVGPSAALLESGKRAT